MKRLILLAALVATPAFADDPAAPQQPPVAAAPAQPEPPKIAPAAPPVQPSVWMIGDLDANDLATLNSCMEELPYKVYRQFTARLNSKIKIVK